MVTYNQLANYLLSIDINIWWLSRNTSKATLSANTLITYCDWNQAGQFLPTRSTTYIDATPSLALDRPHDYSSSTSSLLTAYSRTAALSGRRSNTPTPNPKHAGDTYYNCDKVGHYSPNYNLPRAPYIELKEL
jgi:hypothetical protein